MAVYVLLAFNDDSEAKEFVKDTLESNGHVTYGDDTRPECVEAQVRGVWKKPTQFCKRDDGHLSNMKKTQSAWTRGKKYGWWVCTVCGKPGAAWAGGSSWYTALGTNLLPQSEIAPEYRPLGWTSPVEWNDLLPLLNPSGEVEFRNDHRAKLSELIRKETHA